jgi:glyoxalase family protein
MEDLMELGGLHHLTAITTEATENVVFYTGVLGLRLVKKTVNQDDVSAYHLFYGDALGRPGTEMFTRRNIETVTRDFDAGIIVS